MMFIEVKTKFRVPAKRAAGIKRGRRQPEIRRFGSVPLRMSNAGFAGVGHTGIAYP